MVLLTALVLSICCLQTAEGSPLPMDEGAPWHRRSVHYPSNTWVAAVTVAWKPPRHELTASPVSTQATPELRRDIWLQEASRARSEGNWGFESGSLSGWHATGNAFDHQPTKGDNPRAREVEPAQQIGTYWVGTYESYDGSKGAPGDIQGESKVRAQSHVAGCEGAGAQTGTLTSDAFEVKRDKLSFLIGGGDDIDNEYVELLVGGERSRRGWCAEGLVVQTSL